MSILVRQKEFDLPVEGLHTAVISRIEDLGIVETANGKRDKAHIFFMILDQKVKHNSDAEVFMTINKVLDGKNNISKLLKTLKISHGEEFDLLELVGRQCCVVIQHNKMDGQAELRATIAAILSKR
jgi:uncharacterized protein YwgA